MDQPGPGDHPAALVGAHPRPLDFCRFNQGIYSGIPTIWNLPPAQVVETRCFFQGDEYCEYHLKWDKKSFLRESWLRLLVPWSLLKSTIRELEQDKELLKHKFNETHALNLQLREKIDQLECLQQTSAAAMSLLFHGRYGAFLFGPPHQIHQTGPGGCLSPGRPGTNALSAGGRRLRPRPGGAGKGLADIPV